VGMRITDECVSCGACVEECPREAISERDDVFTIDPSRCDGCAELDTPACLEVCPNDEAIEADDAPGPAGEAVAAPDAPAPSSAPPSPASAPPALSSAPPAVSQVDTQPPEDAERAVGLAFSRIAFVALLGVGVALFQVGYQAMPSEAPQLALSLWVLHGAAALLGLLGLGLTLLLQARGWSGLARLAGGALGLATCGLGTIALQLGAGLHAGAWMFGLAAAVMGLALLRVPGRR